MFNLEDTRLGIIGLGYVGLPLAVEFGKEFPTLGFDIKEERIAELRSGHDSTLEVEPELLARAGQLRFSHHPQELVDCNVYVVTVPTPIDAYKRPDFQPLVS
jgi:UDP-N-acetyl-D-galactosamine dehydrogenase